MAALITTELAEMLRTVQHPGDFYTTGTADIFAPYLEVTGVGPIALPLLPVQAQQLITVAERAPYGRGEETLVDTAVRRTWQIAPELGVSVQSVQKVPISWLCEINSLAVYTTYFPNTIKTFLRF